MRINSNISALNAYNNLQRTDSAMSKNLEKLSSGLRINRAADDAAGLTISEKMRAQVKGLNQAVRNAQDGISLIQTAEGALNETHSILQRMRELSVQSSNDTNTLADRAEIQKEVDQLSQELSRIAGTTEFNQKSLLDGTFEGKFQIGANTNQNIGVSISDMRGQALGVTGAATTDSALATVAGTVANGAIATDDIGDGDYTVSLNTTTGNYELLDSGSAVVATSTDGGVTFAGADDTTVTFGSAVTNGTVTVATGVATATVTGSATISDHNLQAGSYTYTAGTTGTLTDESGNVVATEATAGNFVDADGNTVLTATLADGANVTVGGTDVTTQDAANAAITTIDAAISTVSTQRSQLGAFQNRLEHTINNLGTASENLTAAESRIRDLDMAAEMSKFTKNQILIQAGTSMMAQANSKPQSVLSLLG